MVRTGRGVGALVVVAVALSLAVVAATPAEAATTRPAAETAMLAKINHSRSQYGLSKLRMNLQMVRLGREWARKMAAAGTVYHRPDLATVIDGDFTRLGENVGMMRLIGADDATLVDRLHSAFMASDGHRAAILGRFNQAGVGIFRTSDDAMWVAVNFIKGPRDGFPLYGDIANSSKKRAIERLFFRGALKGCTRNRYCPRDTASRAFVAAVIDRATKTRTASSYVAANCSTSTCRYGGVTRRELALMLAGALRLEGSSSPVFGDVKAADRPPVNAVVATGAMAGCSTSRFCPGKTLTRAQVAASILRAITAG